MNYVLFGENESELDMFIKSLLKDNSIEDVIYYNYSETSIEDVIEEASYLDLFGSKKLIVLNESDFLTSKCTLESKILEDYLVNPNTNTFLVFKVITDKLDERKKLLKFMKDKVIIKEFPLVDEKNLFVYINNYLNKLSLKIERDAVYEIISRLKSNRKVIINELDKLALYSAFKDVVTIEDVRKVITVYEDENKLFLLVDAVMENDKSNIFKLYGELINSNVEVAVIIYNLANQFRLFYQVNVLAEKGMDKKSISNMLKEHPYRVELALSKSINANIEKYLDFLSNLHDIDFKIKTGLLDKNQALESFFLAL